MCALRGGINNFYFEHRYNVDELLNKAWFYKVHWSFPSHFSFKSLINARAHFTFISGQLLIYNLRQILSINMGLLLTKRIKIHHYHFLLIKKNKQTLWLWLGLHNMAINLNLIFCHN